MAHIRHTSYVIRRIELVSEHALEAGRLYRCRLYSCRLYSCRLYSCRLYSYRCRHAVPL